MQILAACHSCKILHTKTRMNIVDFVLVPAQESAMMPALSGSAADADQAHIKLVL
jgi:hypothetical protein